MDLTGQDEAVVEVGAGASGFKFDPADIIIEEGTTVRWVWTGKGGQHNVVESDGEDPLDDPMFESELVSEEGHEFTYTFGEAGTYNYVCEVHINQAMLGSVRVLGENMSVDDVDNVEVTTDDEDSDDGGNISAEDDGDGDEMSDSDDSSDDVDGESESPGGDSAESEGLPGFTVVTAVLALLTVVAVGVGRRIG